MRPDSGSVIREPVAENPVSERRQYTRQPARPWTCPRCRRPGAGWSDLAAFAGNAPSPATSAELRFEPALRWRMIPVQQPLSRNEYRTADGATVTVRRNTLHSGRQGTLRLGFAARPSKKALFRRSARAWFQSEIVNEKHRSLPHRLLGQQDTATPPGVAKPKNIDRRGFFRKVCQRQENCSRQRQWSTDSPEMIRYGPESRSQTGDILKTIDLGSAHRVRITAFELPSTGALELGRSMHFPSTDRNRTWVPSEVTGNEGTASMTGVAGASWICSASTFGVDCDPSAGVE